MYPLLNFFLSRRDSAIFVYEKKTTNRYHTKNIPKLTLSNYRMFALPHSGELVEKKEFNFVFISAVDMLSHAEPFKSQEMYFSFCKKSQHADNMMPHGLNIAAHDEIPTERNESFSMKNIQSQ